MNAPHFTPKPAPKPVPSAAAHTPSGKAHAGHSLDTHSHGEHSHEGHRHADHVHPAASPADLTPARPALLSASPITSVLGWPAWLRVLAVLPVLLLLWLAVAWASAEVAPW